MSRFSDEPSIISHKHGYHGVHSHTLTAYRYHDQPKDEVVVAIDGLANAWRDQLDAMVDRLRREPEPDIVRREMALPIVIMMGDDGMLFLCKCCGEESKTLDMAVIHWQVDH